MTEFTEHEIAMCFVREFAVGGETLSPSSSLAYRRERIRVAILAADKAGRCFYDSGMTYAEAFRRCYGGLLELRSVPRVPAPTLAQVLGELEDSDDKEDEEDDL